MKKNLLPSLAIAILLVSLFSNSCKKSDNNYFISGHIYTGCPATPTANIEVEIYQEPDTSHGILTGKVLTTAKSDGSGYFRIETGFRGLLSLRFTDGSIIIPGLSSYSVNHPYLKIYKDYPTTLQVAVKATISRTNQDTLYTTIPDSTGNFIKKAGPFSNTIVTIFHTNTVFTNIVRNEDDISTHPSFSYHINNDTVKTAAYTLSLCDTSYAKITLP